MAKEKDERYQTAKDLLIDLRNLRRKLDVDAEIDRTVAPQLRTSSGSASRASTQRTQTDAGVTSSGAGLPNFERRISRHRNQAAQIRDGPCGSGGHCGLIGLGLYLSAGKNEVAIKSIAVMPFVNESGNADIEYLSDGMTETLINSLSHLPNLIVKARSSVFRYKGKETDPQTIGKELNVQAILNGRVVQRGDQLTLTSGVD